jgi:peptide/nickel transport system permease protein
MSADLGVRPMVVEHRATRVTRLRRILHAPLAATAAVVLSVVVVIAVVFAPLAATAANRQNLAARFQPPFHLSHGWTNVLGTDALGRSELTQLVFSARTTLVVAASAVVLATVVGFFIGMSSGYLGGWVDAVVMRVSDVIVTMPSLLLALAVLYVLTPSVTNLVFVLAFTRIPVFMRVSRAQALALRERLFVEASRSIGASKRQIIWHDLRPMITPTVLTVSMLELANVMLAAAGLSFLGVGLQRPDVDWGTMVSEGRQYLSQAWWVTVFPGGAVLITALAANILSNWLRATGDPMQAGLLLAPTTTDFETES